MALEESRLYSKEGLKSSLNQIIKILGKLNLGTLAELTDEDKKIINEILTKMDNQKKLIEKLIQ